jgi:DNA-binding beta-propeller fold protein YncE
MTRCNLSGKVAVEERFGRGLSCSFPPTGTGVQFWNGPFGSNNLTPMGTTVSVVDLRALLITSVVSVGLQPSGIVMMRDGRSLLVTNYSTTYAGAGYTGLTAGQGTVSRIVLCHGSKGDSAKLEPPTWLVGQSPGAIVLSPDGRFACVSNYTSSTVTILRL